MVIGKELFWKLVRFGIVGVIVMGCFMGLNGLFHRAFGLGTYTAFLLAYPPALLVHYFLNKRWTFASNKAATGQEVRDYLMTVTITFVIQSAVFAFLSGYWPQLPNWLAAGGASAAQMVFSFLLMQVRVFAPPKASRPASAEALLGPGEKIATAVVLLGLMALYAWTIMPVRSDWSFPAHETDYYNLQVHGFLKGQLAMDVALPPGAAGDVLPPGAPSLLDASYYHGRYYLYFGATPAVLLFLPYHLLTGNDLDPQLALLALGSAGLLLGVAGLAAVRRRHFPQTSALAWLAAVLLVGLATGLIATLRRSLFYEVASTSAFACWAGLFWCLCRASAAGHRRAWLAGASAFAGLAFASRPDVGVGAALVLPFAAVWGWRQERPRRVVGLGRWLLAGGLPVGAVAGLVFAYNAARFRHPFDFGHSHQIGSISAGFVSARYFWHNLGVYYLTPPTVGWYFPFFGPGMEGARPAGYIGVEAAHGEWIFLPFLVILLGVWIGALRGRAQTGARFLILTCLLWFAGNAALLCMVSARANRYSLDFHPALAALCAIGVLAIGAWRGRFRRLILAVALAWVAVAVAFNVGAALESQGFLRDRQPEVFAAVARRANALVAPFQRWLGREPGAQEYVITFGRVVPGRSEPLLYAGTPGSTDMLRIVYESATTARLYFDHGSYGTVMGRPFSFVPGQRYRFVAALGTFFPPEGHPWYGGRAAADQRWLRSHLRVTLDGAIVLEGDSPTFDGLPPRASPGQACDFELVEGPFAGRLDFVRPVPLDAAVLDDPRRSHGWAQLVLRFPRARETLVEPLVATGYGQHYNLVCVNYVDATHVRFEFFISGGAPIISEPVAVDYTQVHRLEVKLVPFLSGADARGSGAVSGPVSIWLDDRRVMAATALQFVTPPHEVFFGARPWPGDASRSIFGGEILAVSRVGETLEGVDRILGHGGAWDFTVAFPEDRTGQAEPLFSRGVAGNGESIYVRYLSDHAVQFGYDSWGTGGQLGPPIELDYAHPHALSLVFGAGLSAEDPERGSVQLSLDGKSVIDGPVTFSTAPGAHLIAGVNPNGMSTSGARFGGDFLTATPAPRENPTLTLRHGGTINLRLRLPPGRTGQAEPLVEAGVKGAATVLYLRYVSDHAIVVGLDRWGSDGFETAPAAVDFGKPVRLTLGFGAFYPGGDPRAHRLRVEVNGTLICDRPAAFYPAAPTDWCLGRNPLEMSTCGPAFTGVILSIQSHP